MKKELELSLVVLKDVLDEHVLFADALSKVFKTNVDLRPYRSVVAGLVGCELRHQIYFDYMTKDLKDFTPEQRRLLSLVLANLYFFRRFNPGELEEDLKASLGEEKYEACKPLIELAATPENYIPASVDRRTPTYLSLRFNVPEWVVKVMSHFGGQATYQSLRKFSRPASTTLRVRTSVLSLERLLNGEGYKESAVPGIVFYTGAEPLRRVEDFKKGRLFPERMLTKAVVDAHPVADPDEILVYNANKDSSLEREIIETYGDKVGINVAVPSVDEKPEVTKLISDKALHNVNYFSAPDPTFMDAAISKPLQLVIVSPDSTNFDLIPSSPDYLLHFDTGSMDQIIEKERLALEGASRHVAEGGTLIYMVYTISRKEGRQTVSNFLKAHPEFTLVQERQYFPHEEYETAAYVAEIVKGEKALALGASPLSELAAFSAPASPVSSAGSK